jgi:competence protein ComEC
LFEARHSVTDYVWRLTAVSIAAQCATFPLGVLYFHQFPNYFLLSNLVVIPAAAVIVVLGMVLLAVSWIPAVAGIVGWVLGWVIKLMNAAIFGIQALPLSVVDNIHITALECILLVIFIALGAVMWTTRKAITVTAMLVIVVFLSISMWHRVQRDVMPHSVTIYNVPGQSVVDFYHGGKGYGYNDGLGTDQKANDYYVQPNRMAKGVMRVENCAAFSTSLNGGELMSWHGKTFLVVKEGLALPSDSFIDYLIVSHNAVDVVSNLPDRSKVGLIILDSSNSRETASTFLRQHQHDRNVYSVLHDGAWTLTL